jgi:hypothetical protein
VKLFAKGGGVPAEVLGRADLRRGEKVLAAAPAADGSWLLGTRGSLVLVLPSGVEHLPWEQVEDAAWDKDGSRLRITGVGSYGEPRPSYTFVMEDPALLLQLVRERVTASIVLQRRVPVLRDLGLTVIGRRSPVGGPVNWMHAYDPGLDPNDPEVAAVADAALAQAQSEVGDDPPSIPI